MYFWMMCVIFVLPMLASTEAYTHAHESYNATHWCQQTSTRCEMCMCDIQYMGRKTHIWTGWDNRVTCSYLDYCLWNPKGCLFRTLSSLRCRHSWTSVQWSWRSGRRLFGWHLQSGWCAQASPSGVIHIAGNVVMGPCIPQPRQFVTIEGTCIW